jgi:hypothetical protein
MTGEYDQAWKTSHKIGKTRFNDESVSKNVEDSGFEPLTPCMPCKCSTN